MTTELDLLRAENMKMKEMLGKVEWWLPQRDGYRCHFCQGEADPVFDGSGWAHEPKPSDHEKDCPLYRVLYTSDLEKLAEEGGVQTVHFHFPDHVVLCHHKENYDTSTTDQARVNCPWCLRALQEPDEDVHLAFACRHFLWTLTAGLADIRGARYALAGQLLRHDYKPENIMKNPAIRELAEAWDGIKDSGR
jgi:hypothetical protein